MSLILLGLFLLFFIDKDNVVSGVAEIKSDVFIVTSLRSHHYVLISPLLSVTSVLLQNCSVYFFK